jgi:hypothetical protein
VLGTWLLVGCGAGDVVGDSPGVGVNVSVGDGVVGDGVGDVSIEGN